MKTQCEKIIDYMEEHGSITQLEALQYCGCLRLASRIHDIRRMGVNIVAETIKVKNRDGSYSNVAEYHIETEEKDG